MRAENDVNLIHLYVSGVPNVVLNTDVITIPFQTFYSIDIIL